MSKFPYLGLAGADLWMAAWFAERALGNQSIIFPSVSVWPSWLLWMIVGISLLFAVLAAVRWLFQLVEAA